MDKNYRFMIGLKEDCEQNIARFREYFKKQGLEEYKFKPSTTALPLVIDRLGYQVMDEIGMIFINVPVRQALKIRTDLSDLIEIFGADFEMDGELLSEDEKNMLKLLRKVA